MAGATSLVFVYTALITLRTNKSVNRGVFLNVLQILVRYTGLARRALKIALVAGVQAPERA